jgi:hypothetical protein
MAEPDQLDLVHKAILAGVGNIQWKESAAKLVLADPDLGGLTPKGIRELLCKFVQEGNKLEARAEKRPEYQWEHPYWYRAIIPVVGFGRGLFVEVILVDNDPEEPFVEIVSAHRQYS